MPEITKVLIPFHDFYAGGAEIHATRLAGEWGKSGVKVHFLMGASDGELGEKFAAVGEVTVLQPEIPRSTFSRLGLGSRMIDPIAKVEPDLVFVPGNFHFVLAHAIRKRLPHLPIVGKVSNPLLPPEGLLGVLSRTVNPPQPSAGLAGVLSRTAQAGMKAYLAPFNGLVTMSHGLEAECRNLVTKNTRLTTILDPTLHSEVAIMPMRQRNLAQRPIRVLVVGRFESQKDIPLAIDTLRCLRAEAESILTIVGDGSQRDAVEAQIHRLGLSQHVRLTGFIDTVADEFDQADVLLITSKFEGGPATAAEALARGVPIVSTDCSWFLHEILQDPTFGTISHSRAPHALARAILQQMQQDPARAASVEAVLSRCRYSVSAAAYLAEFKTIQRLHTSQAAAAGAP